MQTLQSLKQLTETLAQQQTPDSFDESLLSSFSDEDQFHIRLAVAFWSPSIATEELGARKDLLHQICFALQLFNKYFVHDIESLLTEHPIDEKDEDENLFWGG